MGGLSLCDGLLGSVPPCGQGGSLRDGGGEFIGGSRGGGCLNTDDSVWLLWEDFSSGECLGNGRRIMLTFSAAGKIKNTSTFLKQICYPDFFCV